jgi:hypothetical protein
MKSRINAYFDENEEQHTSPWYIGLFPQLARQACQAMHPPAPTSTALASNSALHNVTNSMLQNNQQSPFLENHQLTVAQKTAPMFVHF